MRDVDKARDMHGDSDLKQEFDDLDLEWGGDLGRPVGCEESGGSTRVFELEPHGGWTMVIDRESRAVSTTAHRI